MIADVIIKAAGMEPPESQPYFPRPSGAGPERCMRQMVYHALGIAPDQKRNDRFILVLDDSSIHETLTEDWLNKTVFQLHSQQMAVNLDVTDMFPDAKQWIPERTCETCARLMESGALPAGSEFIPAGVIHGHIDGIVTDMMFVDTHYEHKGLNHFTFEKIWNSEAYPQDYITQCCIYQRGIRVNLNPDITRSVLLIKNKNTAAYMDFLIEYDLESDTAYIVEMSRSSGEKVVGSREEPIFVMENIVRNAMAKFREVYIHVQNGTFPDRQYELSDWQCQYCPWGNIEGTCWQGFEEEYNALGANGVLDGIEDILAKYIQANADLGTKRNPGFEQEYIDLKGKIIALFDQANEFLRTNLPELCAYYLETKGHIDTLEGEKEAVKTEVRDLLRESRVRKATAGPYVVDDRLDKYSYLNRDKLDPAAVIQATEKRFKRVLTIRRPK